MNPEAVAQLRHALRTPLNHLIGYAEMVRDEAREQGNRSQAALMGDALDLARKIVDRVQQALPLRSHIAPDAIPGLRGVMRPALEKIDRALNDFETGAGGACEVEIRKMRAATRELLVFARGAEPIRPAPPEVAA